MKEEDKRSLGIKKANLLGAARSQESETKERGPSATSGGDQTEGQRLWRIKAAPGAQFDRGGRGDSGEEELR